MPLVELTAPAGILSPDAKRRLQGDLATAVLNAMALPQTPFFRSATWIVITDRAPEDFGAGDGGDAPRFLVTITALSGFLDAERNEALAAEITQLIRKAAATGDGPEASVWTVVHEVPEGCWSVNDRLTRRAAIDTLIAQAAAESAAST